MLAVDVDAYSVGGSSTADVAEGDGVVGQMAANYQEIEVRHRPSWLIIMHVAFPMILIESAQSPRGMCCHHYQLAPNYRDGQFILFTSEQDVCYESLRY